ncbi:MAG TPA: LysM peptidoglycan-binding domain-containing protein [Rhodanobacteraceae bacterium]|nr:LysM peptidoglycan-binding domain-containing protein [Rhodanobacteraceae bacterium]
MFKKLLALTAGLAITFAAYAAGAQLRPGHPHTYVVKKGDTLWSISARFLERPWLWPEIWDVNQQVFNPHRIYPGDVLNLDVNGLHVAKRAKVEANPIPTVPLSAIKPFLKDYRVLTQAELKQTPYVVAVEGNEPVATEGMNLYVRNLAAASVGQRFAIVRPTHIYRDYGGNDKPDDVAHLVNDNVDIVPGPWQEATLGDGHWGKGREIGTEVRVIGTAQMLKPGDTATLLLTNASMDVHAGDRLLPVDDTPYDFTYYPHPPRSAPSDAHVLALSNGYDGISAQGPMDVVALNVGSDDGVDNGTTFAIYQPGDNITDRVRGNTNRPEFGPKVKLPDEFVGHVMVFRTFAHVSYGLMMDGIRPVRVHDVLRSPD